jgi:membrane protein
MGEPDQESAGDRRRRLAGASQRALRRYERTRARLDTTTAGRISRRVVEIDLMHQALILAALTLMLLIPLLVSLAAVFPLGAPDGSVPVFSHRLGLSDAATRDLQQLFPSRDRVRGDTTWLGVVLSLLSAFTWPIALQRGYELAWRQPTLGLRGIWRPLVWLLGFIALIAVVSVTDRWVSGWVGVLVTAIAGLVLVTAWAWWSQHLLLGGRVGWRELLPGAVLIGVGLVGLRLFSDAFMSEAITTHYARYGPLGIVFMLLSWFIAFSVILLGGALLGAELYEHRLRRRDHGAITGSG